MKPSWKPFILMTVIYLRKPSRGAIAGNPFNIEARTIFPDGPIHWFNTQGFPRNNKDGKIVELFGTLQDITERKHAEEALRFTQYAIDKATDHALWTTEDGRIFYVNDAACRTLGYSREELLKFSIPDIAPPSSPETFAEHWRNLRKNGSIIFETSGRTKDGHTFPGGSPGQFSGF